MVAPNNRLVKLPGSVADTFWLPSTRTKPVIAAKKAALDATLLRTVAASI